MSRRAKQARVRDRPPVKTAPALKESTWWTLLGCVATVAFLLRLTVLLELRGTPAVQFLIGDAHQYDVWAQGIAAGQWLGSEIFYQTPLYPYLLAVVFKLAGHHVFLVRLGQCVLGSASCVLLGIAGRQFFSPAAGIASAVLLAMYPPAIFFDGIIQKAALDLALMTVLLALMGDFETRSRATGIFTVGLVLGLLMLNRENARVIVPVVAAWVFFAFRTAPLTQRLRWVAALGIGVALTTAPVGLRNYVVGRQFLISTSQMGANLYIGNHTGASGTYDPLLPRHANALYERDDATKLAETAAGRRLSAEEVSSYWTTRTLEEVRAAPMAWAGLMGRKLLMTINASEVPDTESLAFYAGYSVLLRSLSWLSFGVIFPIAAFGVWTTRDRWRRLSVLYAVFLALAISVALFFVFARYRYPLVPIVLLFAGSGIVTLASFRAARRAALPAVATVILAATIANVPISPSSDPSYFNVADELVRAGRAAEALTLLRTAIVLSPDNAHQQDVLARALIQTGDKAAAEIAFQNAVRLDPGDVESRNDYGELLLSIGRYDEAIAQLRTAVKLQPEKALLHANLGSALGEHGPWSEAIAEYREAIRLEPSDAVAHNSLGRALAQTGSSVEAIREFETALSLRPSYAEAHNNLALLLQHNGDEAGAAEHFQAAVRAEPGKYGMHANYGDFLLATGRTNDAIAEYDRAVQLAPDSIDVNYRLAEALVRAERWDDALDALRKTAALALAQNNAQASARIAEAIRIVAAQR